MRSVWSVVAAAACLLAVAVADPVGDRVAADADQELWWHHAVIYQIYPRSFKDSDGDGVGDLKGITSKLQYLKDLGVGALWLSPIYPSPQADFGYDISNFVEIDPQYGTMEDFDNLLKASHSLDLKVVLDFVPNHSSDEHEWFMKSVKGDEKYKDYYVWSDGKKNETTGELILGADGKPVPPNNWVSSFKGSAWEWNEQRKQFYLHQFAVKQPDLNYRNPQVVDEMKDAIRFWMKKGVDGLRVDAVTTLFEDTQLRDEPHNPDSTETDPEERGYYSHIYMENLDETYDMVYQWRQVLDELDKKRIMMTEAYATLNQTMLYYGTPARPGASFSFNFNLITSLGAASKAKDFQKVIQDWMHEMTDFRRPNWVIGNHDQFRVGSFYRYGPELADGINMISMLLPGTAMTYNGEEIGMDNTYITWEQTKDPQAVNEGPNNYLTHSRDLGRTPFQWDDTTSAGFSTNKSTWLPVNSNYWHLNMKAQLDAEHSHLKMYKALLKARAKPAVQSANYEVKALHDVLVINRDLEGQDSFVVVVNIGSEEATVKISDLGKYDSLNVWTSSVNSAKRPGNSVPASVNLRPKEGLVLTTGAVGGITTQSPSTSETNAPTSPTKAPTSPTTAPSTAKPNGSPAAKAAIFVSLLVPLICLIN